MSSELSIDRSFIQIQPGTPISEAHRDLILGAVDEIFQNTSIYAELQKEGLHEKPGLVKRATTWIGNHVPGVNYIAERIGINLAVRHNAALTNAAIGLTMIFLGSQGGAGALFTRNALQYLYSEQLLEYLWKPAGIIAANIGLRAASESISRIFQRKNEEAGQAITQLRSCIRKDEEGRIVNFKDQPLSEKQKADCRYLYATVIAANAILNTSKEEMEELFSGVREEIEQPGWIDQNAQSLSDLGIQVTYLSRPSVMINTAVKVLSGDSLIENNAAVVNSFKLLAYFFSQTPAQEESIPLMIEDID